MLGKLSWAAIPFNEPLPLISAAVNLDRMLVIPGMQICSVDPCVSADLEQKYADAVPYLRALHDEVFGVQQLRAISACICATTGPSIRKCMSRQ